ncbi:MAG: hypothetical protein ACO36E_08335 [Synechocystis sp.]
MASYLSKLASFSLDSLLPQGLDTILKRQTQSGTPPDEPIRAIKKSLDQKGELFRLPPSHDFTLAAYQIRHQDASGSVLITLDNLRKFHKFLNKEIIEAAERGDFKKADKYIHQQHNVDIHRYTHRIKAYRVTDKKAKILVWIIDLDLHKESSDEQSYGSGTARAMTQDLAINYLDHPVAKAGRRDYLDTVIDLDWVEEIRQAARPFYNHSLIQHKIIFHHPLNTNYCPVA